MKWRLTPFLISLFLFQLSGTGASAQTDDPIFYFKSPEDTSLIGVKTAGGKILIPARFYNIDLKDPSVPIKEAFIELRIAAKDRKVSDSSPVIPVTAIYSRSGKLLYYAQLYDNGGDYFEEGLRRYVDDNKIGFVNRSGEICIPATWDFATPFNYGYAIAYTGGWKRVADETGEHWSIAPTSRHSTSYLINTKGEIVKPVAKKKKTEDYLFKGKVYPYPFVYTGEEKRIIASLNEFHVKALMRFTDHADTAKIRFEIVERPTTGFPYYIMKSYEEGSNTWSTQLAADAKGRQFFVFHDFTDHFTMQPLKDWLKKRSGL